jgi:hypothetical protein
MQSAIRTGTLTAFVLKMPMDGSAWGFAFDFKGSPSGADGKRVAASTHTEREARRRAQPTHAVCA